MPPGDALPFAGDCCGGLSNLDYSKHVLGTGQSASRWQQQIWPFRRKKKKVDVRAMARLLGYVDVTDAGFTAAVLSIAFNPLFWNVLHGGHEEPAEAGGLGLPLGLRLGLGHPGRRDLVCHLQLLGSGLRRHLPRRLLRHPDGGEGDELPFQRPGQPHVLGQHRRLPGLGPHARKPSWPFADGCSGNFLHNCNAVRGPVHGGDLPAEGSGERIAAGSRSGPASWDVKHRRRDSAIPKDSRCQNLFQREDRRGEAAGPGWMSRAEQP
ncbi:phosphatidylethanolamine N-methyltransferase isoform X2 [Rhea pennata]|uniref:phosphatidylethanolamine N-methyltransferase isoform X2 n=1 Tax=Rhea pennata TaxID=8795 RepID=UPI002E26E0AE